MSIGSAIRVGVLVSLSLCGPALSAPRCTALSLPVWRIEVPPSQYTAFCEEEPAACALRGATVLDFDDHIAALQAVNLGVNTEVEADTDLACHGVEEKWTFPSTGWGDCEDFALEKRRRLVGDGLSSAALTMAIVHHEVRFFPHAVLLAETTRGTFVLDQLHDEVLCWDALPYRWERRERPDGQWDRFALP